MSFIPAATTLVEMLLMQGSKALPLILPAIETAVSGVVATAAFGSAINSSRTSVPTSTPSAPALVDDANVSATPSPSSEPGFTGTSITSRATIASAFPSLNMNHAYLQGYRDTMNLAALSTDEIMSGSRNAQYENIREQEYRLIGRVFGLLPTVVESSDVLSELALPALMGDPTGDMLFTEQNLPGILARNPEIMREVDMLSRRAIGGTAAELISNMPIVGQVLSEAKGDFEMKNERPVTDVQFASAMATAGLSAARLTRAARAVVGRFGNTQAARATLRGYIANRLLPGVAGAALTWGLEQAYNSWITPSGARLEGNHEFRVEEDTLQYELDRVYRELRIGDSAASGTRDYSDSLPPIEGSVLFTPAPASNYGTRNTCMPPRTPDYPVLPSLKRPQPGRDIFNYLLEGTSLSERADDDRARRTRTKIDQPLPMPAPSALNEPTFGQGLGVEKVADAIKASAPTSNISTTHGGDATVELRKRISAWEQTQPQDQHVTQNFDPAMSTSIPASVSGATSTRAQEYSAENQGYRQFLDDAPNLVGVGYDECSVERELMERLTTTEGGVPRQQFGKQTIEPDKSEVNDKSYVDLGQPDRPGGGNAVAVAEMKNPVFTNIGKSVPQKPLPSTQPSTALQN